MSWCHGEPVEPWPSSARRLSSLLLAVILLGATAPPRSYFRALNLMPAFWQAWTQTEHENRSAQVAAIRRRVIAPNRALYGQPIFVISDSHLRAYVDELPPRIAGMRAMSSLIETGVPVYRDKFAYTFPDFDARNVAIYFLPSFMAFDRTSTTISGKPALLFGVDDLATENVELPVVIDHELFTTYHRQVNPAFFANARASELYRYGVYRQIWAEGLAAYVSRDLNQPETLAATLFSKELAGMTADQQHRMLCAALDVFESRSADDAALLFDPGRHPKGLPPRGGYYVGYVLAETLSKRFSLQTLAKMDARHVQALLKEALTVQCMAA